MSLSIQRSVIEQFNFNGKSVRSVYVKGTGECLVASDVYSVIGYDRENGKKAIQSLVHEKYKLRFGDVNFPPEGGEEFFPTQPNTILLKEPGLYSFLLRCKKPEAESFMEWVVEKVLPREVRKLAETIDAERHKVREKDSQLALLNDELTEAQEHLRQLEFNNVGLQGEVRAKNEEIERREAEVAELRQRYVDRCQDVSKDNVVMIVRKHTREQDDCHFEYPYYISRIQRRKIPAKRRWIIEQFPQSEEIVVIDNPNSVHTFNRFEEEGHVERYGCHFRLIDLTREDLYAIGVPAIKE